MRRRVLALLLAATAWVCAAGAAPAACPPAGGTTASLQALKAASWQRADLQSEAAPADADGFHQPFAALVLAEVARVDRLQPFLAADARDALVGAAGG